MGVEEGGADLRRHSFANGAFEDEHHKTKVREIVVPEDGNKSSELYVDASANGGLPLPSVSKFVRLDPSETGAGAGHISSFQYTDTPSTKLQVANTMPTENIKFILDEEEKKPAQEGETPGGELARMNSAPSLLCLDSKSDAFEDGEKRLAREKSQRPVKLSHRKKKLLRRLGSVVDGALEIDEADENLKILSDLYELDEAVTESRPEDVKGKKVLPLQIVLLIVGTRGDVQPFVAIGKELQKDGHRVRLATHQNFKEFVRSAGLEFYPLGGDPKVLAGYMVKNKGFLPSGPKEVKLQRKQLKSIVYSLYPACIAADQDTGVSFRAQAIISNPPAYGHVHVAEALGVPLHIYFTMPWTPTNEFPHPLSRIKSPAMNRLSYQIVDLTIWLGIRSLINGFRKKLKLRPLSYLGRTTGSISNLPTCYMWSPSLVPKPNDWGPLVDVVGYCFLELANDYEPPAGLVKWLQSGTPPIYLGFGSLPVDDPVGKRDIFLEALKATGQRGLIDKGWDGIGNMPNPPDFVRFISNCPHDWLFPQCGAVIHHGGAGTTAAGLKAACPTTVVPFFGDQPFWGERIHDRGIGPAPIPVNRFSFAKLVDAIDFMLSPEVKQRAQELAEKIEAEDGVGNAVRAFYKHLPPGMPLPHPIERKKRAACRKAFMQVCCYQSRQA